MKATDTQIGGSHYKDYAIQPIEFIYRNKIPFPEANVIKYVLRHRYKNGIQDLRKAKHYIDLLIELEYETPQEQRGKIKAKELKEGHWEDLTPSEQEDILRHQIQKAEEAPEGYEFGAL